MKKLNELIQIELYDILYFIFYHLPGYYLSNKLRGWFMGFYLKEHGNKFLLNKEVIIESPQNIYIGNDVRINARCWISGGGGLTIEDNVLIGPLVIIHTANHMFEDTNTSISSQGHIKKPVVIKKNSWIGASSIILPGTSIGENCIIGAGSVVTKDTDSFSVYAGNPAKKIRSLKVPNNV